MDLDSADWHYSQGHHEPSSRDSAASKAAEARENRVIARADSILGTALSARTLLTAPDIELEYVLPGLVRGTLGIVVGTGASSKSMLALYMGISVALGRDLFGLFPDHKFQRGRVVFLSLEDAATPLSQRYQRLLKSLPREIAEEIAQAEELRWLCVVPSLEVGLHPYRRDPRTQVIEETEDAAVVELLTRGVALLVIDTLSVLSGPNGLDENSNSDMGPLISSLNRMAARNKCAIALLHHVAKGDESGHGRGASAIGDNARWRLSLRPMTKEEAKVAFGEEDAPERLQWIKIEWTKQNYAAPRDPMWLQRVDGLLKLGYPPLARTKDGKPKKPSGALKPSAVLLAGAADDRDDD